MSDTHHTIDVDRACSELNVLHERVTHHWGRVEIIRGDRTDPCDVAVLISKAELETMERALEILCELPGGQEICKELTGVARDCMEGVHIAGICGDETANNSAAI